MSGQWRLPGRKWAYKAMRAERKHRIPVRISPEQREERKMFKKLSDKPVAQVQNEQVEKWKEEDLLKMRRRQRRLHTVRILRRPAYSQRQAGHTPCNGQDPQRLRMPLQDHAGLSGKQKGRMGHPRTSCRNRSRKAAPHVRQAGH